MKENTNKTNEEKEKVLTERKRKRGKENIRGKKWDENDIRVQNKESRRNIQVKNSKAGMNNIFKKY